MISTLSHDANFSLNEKKFSQNEKLTIAFLIIAVCVTNFWVLKGCALPWIGAAAGFLLAVCLPAWMLFHKIDWPTDAPSERLLYSVASAVLALMAVGLEINTVLPHLGISRPLDRDPVLAAVDLWIGLLTIWRPRRFRPRIPHIPFDRLQGSDWTVGLLSAFCVPMAVIGANRLNNGAGSGVTLAMLALATLILAFIFAERNRLNPGTLTAAIYFIALAMLLMTSLRGWYTTGHDIQTEYQVFELTKSNGDWDISRFRNAYNACLSITILPTVLWQFVRVDDPYIYKFWFQLFFAFCPVLVYRIALRHTNRATAIIATIYFLAFPTYFTDMPFLNRQEIAFLFVGACVLAATTSSVSGKQVRWVIAIFSLGVVVSHYSTAYVFLGSVSLGWMTYKILAIFRRVQEQQKAKGHSSHRQVISPAIGVANVLVVLVAIVLWNGVATHTVNGLGSTIAQAVNSLRGGNSDSKSGDVSYSVASTGTTSPSALLSQFTTLELTKTAPGRAAGGYYPEAVLKQYPIKIAPQPNVPVTQLGRLVNDVGLNVSTINSITRAGAARLLQVFVAVGLLSAFFTRKRRSRSFTELISLCCGALIIVVLQVVLPVISINYGVLRAFLQAMIVFGPFVAVGSIVIFRFLPPKWDLRAAFTIAIVYFLSLTGVLPQLLGGYPSQLNLNNSGQYYDIYYLHPQEIAAVGWLQSEISASPPTNLPSEVAMNGFTYAELHTFTGVTPVGDIFPPMLQEGAYVFLGYATTTKDQATFSFQGNLVTYIYPLGLLNSTDDLLYSSNGAMIYR